ncbi:MAG: DUF4974 domain-containing protein [Cytophagales bacterium]|nr:DUF4974 domain-containing protein [Cytophagales bacterium]
MDDIHVEKLIVKHLSGETSAKENEFLNSWLQASEKNQRLFHFYKSAWTETALEYKVPNQERVYDKISDNIHTGTGPAESFTYRNRFKIPVLVRAASVIFLVWAGWMLWYVLQKNNDRPPQTVSNAVWKETARGQKLKTFLPDGSVVWLNAESKINELFSDTLRAIHLRGMAYFEVEKDTLRPFVVQSEDVLVTALGTAFSVRAYASEDRVSVALQEGSVLVEFGDEGQDVGKIMLEPGREVHYNVHDRTYLETSAVDDNAFNWRNGVLYFHDASFEQVIRRLSRWYGVEFEVVNQVEDPWHYTATFRNFNLKEVLQSMSYTKDFTYEIHPEKVIIKNLK